MITANGIPVQQESALPLKAHHMAELRASGLSDDTIRQAGIRSEESHHALAQILSRRSYSRSHGPAIVFPFKDDRGMIVLERVKPDHPPKSTNGKPRKYLQPSGIAPRVYFPPGIYPALENPAQELLVTEGEKKALASTQFGFPCIALTGVDCYHAKRSSALLLDLERIAWSGRRVFIAFDSDSASNDDVRKNECLLAAALVKRGAVVKVVRIPAGDNGVKVGLDDLLVQQGPEGLRKLLNDAQEPDKPEAIEAKANASLLDPATEAGRFLETGKQDGVCRLRYWRGSFWLWAHGRYVEKQSSEIRGSVIQHINGAFSHLSSSITSNVLDQVRALSMLRSEVEQPAWLDRQPNDWPAHEVLSARNGLVHRPSVASGATCLIPPSPRYFTPAAIDYQFLPDAPDPAVWLAFLNDLWPDDAASIETLQEWFGYCLASDTTQQKILLLVGPKRAGKGVVARIVRAMIGAHNVAGPTLSSLASHFGLWPLLGKSLAIISDARLSGRTDQAIVVERLLSISGEDALTVDRKMMEPTTCKLPTRLMVLSNELPRLGDASGALTSRMILLRLTQSFYGREDRALSAKIQKELPGVLLWAIDGWKRLQERGHFQQPQSATGMLGDLEDLGSPVGAFIRECCDVGPGYRVPVKDLFAEWQKWCLAKGRKESGNEQSFGRDLAAAVPELGKSQPRDGDGGRFRCYEGLALRLEF